MEPKIIARREVIKTPYFTLVAKDLAGGKPGDPHYAVMADDYVSIIALTASDEVLLVRQYRPAVEAMCLELPSGHVEKGETPEQGARRELLEETGYAASEWTRLARLKPDIGRLGNHLWCFLARGAAPAPGPWSPEPGVERRLCPAADFHGLVERGEFDHALHLAALYMALARGTLPAALRF